MVFESKVLLNQTNHSTLTWEPQVNLYLNPPRNNQPKENGPPLNGVKNRLEKNPPNWPPFPSHQCRRPPATTSGPRSVENARNFGVAAAENSAVSIATGADYPPSDIGQGLWAKIALKDPWNTHDLSGQCGPTPKKYPNLYQVVNSGHLTLAISNPLMLDNSC